MTKKVISALVASVCLGGPAIAQNVSAEPEDLLVKYHLTADDIVLAAREAVAAK